MNITNYVKLAGQESFGSLGAIGIKIEVGGDLPDINGEEIRTVAYMAVERINEAIIAARMAADPEAQEKARIERQDLLSVFYVNNIMPIFVEEIPNGYCNRACCRHLPWFVVTTTVGRIKIGWRKSVINIDWKDTVDTSGADTLFPDEDVTKGDKSIHAWSLEKAQQYVAKIVASAKKS